tara:strand:+ start:3592 stop:4266 length:675 start_codon:yes stop_codon:yes gene_type:complete
MQVKQCQIAFENGCYGIFLCPAENNINPTDINSIYNHIRDLYPNKFIGINYMNSLEEFINIIPNNVSAIWTDKGIGNIDSIDIVEKINKVKCDKGFLYFGGFFHKGNNNNLTTDKIDSKIEKANEQIDIITTSGRFTGIEIKIDILKHIHSKSKKPIALASGVNINNVVNYINIIEYAIIGTGIEKSTTNEDVIQFYKEAGLSDPVSIGYLDGNKIKEIVEILN